MASQTIQMFVGTYTLGSLFGFSIAAVPSIPGSITPTSLGDNEIGAIANNTGFPGSEVVILSLDNASGFIVTDLTSITIDGLTFTGDNVSSFNAGTQTWLWSTALAQGLNISALAGTIIPVEIIGNIVPAKSEALTIQSSIVFPVSASIEFST